MDYVKTKTDLLYVNQTSLLLSVRIYFFLKKELHSGTFLAFILKTSSFFLKNIFMKTAAAWFTPKVKNQYNRMQMAGFKVYLIIENWSPEIWQISKQNKMILKHCHFSNVIKMIIQLSF